MRHDDDPSRYTSGSATIAVSRTNSKLPSFRSSWSYLLKVTGVPADDPRRINMMQLSDWRNVAHVIRQGSERERERERIGVLLFMRVEQCVFGFL